MEIGEDGQMMTTTRTMVKANGGSTTTEFANIQEWSFGLQRSRSHTLQGYEDSSWSSFNNYNGRGQGGYDAPDQGGRFDNDPNYERRQQGGGFANRKRHVSSEPSPHVIFLGLDPDFTEADVSRDA